jgi:hypothetical protein
VAAWFFLCCQASPVGKSVLSCGWMMQGCMVFKLVLLKKEQHVHIAAVIGQ